MSAKIAVGVADDGRSTKYDRLIVGVDGSHAIVDVYAVLAAFCVTCPARQHAIKKLLCAGKRGIKEEARDLEEARDSIDRAIQLLAVPDTPRDPTGCRIPSVQKSESE